MQQTSNLWHLIHNQNVAWLHGQRILWYKTYKCSMCIAQMRESYNPKIRFFELLPPCNSAIFLHKYFNSHNCTLKWLPETANPIEFIRRKNVYWKLLLPLLRNTDFWNVTFLHTRDIYNMCLKSEQSLQMSLIFINRLNIIAEIINDWKPSNESHSIIWSLAWDIILNDTSPIHSNDSHIDSWFTSKYSLP